MIVPANTKPPFFIASLTMQIIARMKAMMLNTTIPPIEMNGIGKIAIAQAKNKQMKAALTGAVFCETIDAVEFSMNMLYWATLPRLC